MLLLCITSAPLRAITTMENLHLGTLQEGFSGSLMLNLSGAGGNSDKSDFTTGLNLGWQQQDYQDFLLASYAFGQSNGETNTDKAFVHLRHIQRLSQDWALEAFTQSGRNRFARLKNRSLLGGGGRYALYTGAKSVAYLGLGAFYANEKLVQTEETSDTGGSDWWANSYVIAKIRLNQSLIFQNILYYQPRFSHWQDFRLLEQAGLQIKLAENLDLHLAVDISHDNEPPENIEKTDSVYSTKIVVGF